MRNGRRDRSYGVSFVGSASVGWAENREEEVYDGQGGRATLESRAKGGIFRRPSTAPRVGRTHVRGPAIRDGTQRVPDVRRPGNFRQGSSRARSAGAHESLLRSEEHTSEL